MKISLNQINFNGRYIVEGTKEEVEYVHNAVTGKEGRRIESLSTIKLAGSRGNEKIYAEIFATNEDSITFSKARKKEEFLPKVKSFKGKLKDKYSQIIEYIFGNKENTRIVDAKSAILEIKRGGYSFMEDGILTNSTNFLLDGSIEKTDFDKKIISIKTADGAVIKKRVNEDESYFKILPDKKYQYFNKDNKKVKSITEDSKKRLTVQFEDGSKRTYTVTGKLIKKTIVTQDGDLENYESGSLESKEFADGSKEFYKYKKLIKKILSDGTTQEYKYNCDSSWFIISSDGNIYYRNPKIENSKIVNIVADKRGNKTVEFDNGSKKNYDSRGNLVDLKRKDDGTIEEYDRKMLVKRILDDGTIERYYSGKIQSRRYPDGSSETFNYNKDGTCFVSTYKALSFEPPVISYLDEENKNIEVVNISSDNKANTTVELASGEKREYDSMGFLVRKINNGITINYGTILDHIYVNDSNERKNIKRINNQDGTSFVIYKDIAEYLDKDKNNIITKKVYTAPNGFITAILQDDSIKIYDSEGYSIPYSASRKSNGTIEEYYCSHLIAKILKDGTVITYQDERINSKKLPDGTIENYQYNKDGTYFILSDNNNRYADNRNKILKIANITMDEDENKTVEFQSGNKKIYNKYGTLTHVVNNGFVITLTPFGDIISKESPNGTVEKYKYGELVSKTYKDGTIENYSHQALASRILSDGTIEECYSNGHVRRRTFADGTVEIYDAYDKLTSKILSDGTIERYVIIDEENTKKVAAQSKKTKYDYRFKRYKSAYLSLASTIAWKLSPSTKQVQSDIAKMNRQLGTIFAKVDENNKYKDAVTFDEPTENIIPQELTRKEQTALNSFHKTSWEISGTEEFSQAGLRAHKAVNDFLLMGIDAIEDRQIKETIEEWIKENPKKYKALIS